MLGLSVAGKIVDGVAGSIDRALTAGHGAKTAASAGATKGEARARATAKDFEAMFLEQSLDQVVRSTGEEGPLGENGTGGGVYRSMLVKEYAGQVVKSGGVGIADHVYRQLMKLQEAAAAPAGEGTRHVGGR
jgi:Rod binding domain-containing protein